MTFIVHFHAPGDHYGTLKVEAENEQEARSLAWERRWNAFWRADVNEDEARIVRVDMYTS